MARLTLPANYLATVASTSLERLPLCKVEIEYDGTYHDVSADVVSVSLNLTMENRSDDATIVLANPSRYYSRLWTTEGDPRADAGHRVRIWMTNSLADYIQVFQGYIVSGANTVKRGEGELATLQCMDNGWRAWQGTVTMEPLLSRIEPPEGAGPYRVRRNAADRQINAIVTSILEHERVGFVGGDISLADLDYPVPEWKPGTFTPMQDIAQLLAVRHHFLRFRYDGKAVSQPIIPSSSSWTYGAQGSYPLHVSFEERWQPPERLASIVNLVGWSYDTMVEVYDEPTKIWEDTTFYFGDGDYQWGPWGSGHCEDIYVAITPPPSAYGDLVVKVPGGSLWAVNTVIWAGMREPPFQDQGIIRVYWQSVATLDCWLDIELWGRLRHHVGAAYSGTATNTELAAAGYLGAVDEQNDYVDGDADCEWLAQRLATWLQNECYPATLVVPCNLVHEPGDLITVNLADSADTAQLVDYIVVSHRIEYERGKPNLSTLDLVRDTAHM